MLGKDYMPIELLLQPSALGLREEASISLHLAAVSCDKLEISGTGQRRASC